MLLRFVDTRSSPAEWRSAPSSTPPAAHGLAPQGIPIGVISRVTTQSGSARWSSRSTGRRLSQLNFVRRGAVRAQPEWQLTSALVPHGPLLRLFPVGLCRAGDPAHGARPSSRCTTWSADRARPGGCGRRRWRGRPRGDRRLRARPDVRRRGDTPLGLMALVVLAGRHRRRLRPHHHPRPAVVAGVASSRSSVRRWARRPSRSPRASPARTAGSPSDLSWSSRSCPPSRCCSCARC